MYYRVKFSETSLTEEFTAENRQAHSVCYNKIFEAKSEKAMEEKISAYVGEITNAEITVLEKTKVSVEELVQEATQELLQEIFKKYMLVKLKPKQLNAQKYAELKDKYLKDPNYLYQMLQYEIKSMLVEEYLGRYNPYFTQAMKDISAKQYFDRVTMLSEGDADLIGD